MTERSYIAIRTTETLRNRLRDGNRDQIEDYLREAVPELRDLGARVVDVPTLPAYEGPDLAGIAGEIDITLFVMDVDARDLDAFNNIPPEGEVIGTGADAEIHAGLQWSPPAGADRALGDVAAADRMIGADALVTAAGIRLTGAGVQVVLMDSGLDAVERSLLPMSAGVRWRGVLHRRYRQQSRPGIARYGHGFRSATQIARLAPDATLHDFAILPPRLSRAVAPTTGVQVPSFVSDATAAFVVLEAMVRLARRSGDRRPWIVVNPWSVFRRRWAPGQDLDSRSAVLNMLIDRLHKLDVDLVFAAGNCGAFCPDARCGNNDIGPGRSIVGPNGHPLVITVGAVRNDDLWLGYSSQGPGALATAADRQKPDICAPSEFRLSTDRHGTFTGTSTASALTGAALAALRERFPDISPGALHDLVIGTARQTDGPGWSLRRGHGVLDLDRLVAALAVA